MADQPETAADSSADSLAEAEHKHLHSQEGHWDMNFDAVHSPEYRMSSFEHVRDAEEVEVDRTVVEVEAAEAEAEAAGEVDTDVRPSRIARPLGQFAPGTDRDSALGEQGRYCTAVAVALAVDMIPAAEVLDHILAVMVADRSSSCSLLPVRHGLHSRVSRSQSRC